MNEQNIIGKTKVDGVVIGVVAALDAEGEPLVAYVGNESELPVVAKTTVAVSSDAIGREVALLFEGGDVTKPIIMGLVCNRSLTARTRTEIPEQETDGISIGKWASREDASELIVDGERVELRAEKEIVLKCGKSSITMTRAGKVIIRGAYISTRSSGANRIKGGSVQIN